MNRKELRATNLEINIFRQGFLVKFLSLCYKNRKIFIHPRSIQKVKLQALDDYVSVISS